MIQGIALLGLNGGGKSTFLRAVASKDNEVVYTSAKKLHCPFVRLDGTETVGKNIKRIMESI